MGDFSKTDERNQIGFLIGVSAAWFRECDEFEHLVRLSLVRFQIRTEGNGDVGNFTREFGKEREE